MCIDINKAKDILKRICVWVRDNIDLEEFANSKEILVSYDKYNYFRIWMYNGIFSISHNHTGDLASIRNNCIEITNDEYQLKKVYNLPNVWNNIKTQIEEAYKNAKEKNEIFNNFVA